MTDTESESRTPRSEGGVRAVSRALTVIDAFDSATTRLSVAALARRVGLPRTTTIRMVETLVDEGMLAWDAQGLLRAGPRLVRWGALAAASWTLPEVTAARLQAASDATGETISLYVRRGLQRTVIGQAQSRHTLRHVVRVGDELPLWGGAAAMVLLASEPADTRPDLVDTVAAASEGRVSAAGLALEVDKAARAGFAVSHGGREPGNSGVAIPLGSSGTHHAPVGLALGGPTVRVQAADIDAILRELRAAAADIAASGLSPALY